MYNELDASERKKKVTKQRIKTSENRNETKSAATEKKAGEETAERDETHETKQKYSENENMDIEHGSSRKIVAVGTRPPSVARLNRIMAKTR